MLRTIALALRGPPPTAWGSATVGALYERPRFCCSMSARVSVFVQSPALKSATSDTPPPTKIPNSDGKPLVLKGERPPGLGQIRPYSLDLSKYVGPAKVLTVFLERSHFSNT
jgi:hypothetical protein